MFTLEGLLVKNMLKSSLPFRPKNITTLFVTREILEKYDCSCSGVLELVSNNSPFIRKAENEKIQSK